MRVGDHQNGFTLVELMVAIAIAAILGAVAVVSYQQYTASAKGTELVVQYDAIRTQLSTALISKRADDCDALAKELNTDLLHSQYANLAYGFEAVSGGYRPVLTICAKADASAPQAVKIAHGAYDTLEKTGVVEKNAVITDSVVSFALRLTEGNAAMCKTAPTQAASTCGVTPPVTQTMVKPVAQASGQPAQPANVAPAVLLPVP